MAKNDNLKDFLTDVANAIREKKGTTDLINPQDFSAEIASIQSGGGALTAEMNDVNFIDHEGTILYSFSKDEFLALSDFPAVPQKEGLISQGWNWDFADAMSQVQKYGVCNIGATYVTDDGKTRLYITIETEMTRNTEIRFVQSAANGVSVDWGDGSELETFDGTNVSASHHYNKIGNYVISLNPTNGDLSLTGGANLSIMGSSLGTNRGNSYKLRKVEVGANVKTLGTYTFNYCMRLMSIAIPNSVTTLGGSCFAQAGLSSFVIPKGVTSISTYLLSYCYKLKILSFPKNIKGIPDYIFYSCYPFSVVVHDGITAIGDNAFRSGIIPSIILPETLTTIGSSAFAYCYGLTSLYFPKNVSSIKTEAFNSCQSLVLCDFSSHTAVPTLSSSNAFNSASADLKIVVPDALYDTWIATTNWSGLSSKIMKKSDWDASQL